MRCTLIALAAAVALSGCGAKGPDLAAEYAAAAASAEALLASGPPEPDQAAAVVEALQRVEARGKGTEWGAKSLDWTGRVLAAAGRHDEAHDAWGAICREYHEFQEPCQMSLIAMGRDFEAQARWPEAQQAYDSLGQHYVTSRLWMESPLYAADMYLRLGDLRRMREAYQRAVRIYRERLQTSLSLEERGRLQHHLAKAHEGAGEIDRAIELLGHLAQLEDGIPRPEVLEDLIRLYEARQQPGRAAAVREELERRHPGR